MCNFHFHASIFYCKAGLKTQQKALLRSTENGSILLFAFEAFLSAMRIL
jgi:hypothetical protein